MWILEYRGDAPGYAGPLYFCLIGGNNYIAGRKDCDLQLMFEHDTTLSRRHALMKVSTMPPSLLDVPGCGTEIFVMDLSKYGTTVNGDQLKNAEEYRQLHVGDEIMFGKGSAKFRLLQRHVFICFDDNVSTATRDVLRGTMVRLGGCILKDPDDVAHHGPTLLLYVTSEMSPNPRSLTALLRGYSFVLPEYVTAFFDYVANTPGEALRTSPSMVKFIPPRSSQFGTAVYKRPESSQPTVYPIPNSSLAHRSQTFRGMCFYFLTDSCLHLYQNVLGFGGGEVGLLREGAILEIQAHIARKFLVLDSAQFSKFSSNPKSLPTAFELCKSQNFAVVHDQNIIDTLVSGCNVGQYLASTSPGVRLVTSKDLEDNFTDGKADGNHECEDVDSDATPDDVSIPEPRPKDQSPLCHVPSPVIRAPSGSRANSPRPTPAPRAISPQRLLPKSQGMIGIMAPPVRANTPQSGRRGRSPAAVRTLSERISLACRDHEIGALRTAIPKVQDTARRAERNKFLDATTIRYLQQTFERNENFLGNLSRWMDESLEGVEGIEESVRMEALQLWHYCSSLNRTINTIVTRVGVNTVFSRGSYSLSAKPPFFVMQIQKLHGIKSAENEASMTPSRSTTPSQARRTVSPAPTKSSPASRYVDPSRLIEKRATSTPRRTVTRSPQHSEHIEFTAPSTSVTVQAGDLNSIRQVKMTYIGRYGPQAGMESFQAWLAGRPPQWARMFAMALERENLTYESL
eukprot:PhF_6_TR37170/c0_g1_i1/m.54749/K10867/NBN, NBS1; nibrin